MTDALLSHVLVPVAGESDAATTADAVLPRVATANGRVTAIVVVEKAGGAPDKASVEQRELAARDALKLVEERAEAVGVPVDTEIVYGTDVADAIIDAAAAADASAIAFTPREGGGMLLNLLTGDVARKLVERSDRPVVSLPAAAGTGDATDSAASDSEEGERTG